MKNLRVTVDGKIYNVSVEMIDEPAAAPQPKLAAATPAPAIAAAPAPVAAPAPAAAAQLASGPGNVTSPLSGKIVSIDVTLGQVIEEGAKVATVEAMKMNTYVFAHKAGKVTEIVAQAGSAVEEGATLLVIG